MITIIAEKPSVAGEIAKIVQARTRKDGYHEGNGYAVTWAYGHLIGLADATAYGIEGSWNKNQLPIMPDTFVTAPIEMKKKESNALYKKQLKVISTLFKKSDKIIVATDAGREGELIFRYIYEYLAKKDKFSTPFERLWISSLTDKAIKDGLATLKPGSEYDNLSAAAKARSEADWLIGINATRATTLNAGDRSVWSVGRVQTPTLCMICKRFLENKNFKSTPYYMIKVRTSKTGLEFWAFNNQKFEQLEQVQEMMTRVNTADKLLVGEVQKKPSYSNPPLLYDLTTIQKEANSKFGLSADTTLKVCQSLYEKKLTTYPRTGSRYIPDDIYATLPQLIRNAEQYPRFAEYAASLRGKTLGRISVNAAKVTDHHALLPTENIPKEGQMTDLERKIYELIVGRMLETVSPREEKDVTTITMVAEGQPDFPFVAKGSVIKVTGWKAVMKEVAKLEEDENAQLPPVNKGDVLPLEEVVLLEKRTKAPPILTDNSLLALMETAGKELEDEQQREAMKDIGLGTPATRAETIEKLIHTQYIVRERKQLLPTEKGLALYEMVKDKSIANVEMTGKWEHVLTLISEGKVKVDKFNEEIRKYTAACTADLLDIKMDTSRLKNAPKRIEMECPRCGAPFIIYDKVCKCSDKDHCGFFFWRIVCQRRLTEKDIAEILQDGQTKGKVKLKKKDGKTFEARLILDNDGNFKMDFK